MQVVCKTNICPSDTRRARPASALDKSAPSPAARTRLNNVLWTASRPFIHPSVLPSVRPSVRPFVRPSVRPADRQVGLAVHGRPTGQCANHPAVRPSGSSPRWNRRSRSPNRPPRPPGSNAITAGRPFPVCHPNFVWLARSSISLPPAAASTADATAAAGGSGVAGSCNQTPVVGLGPSRQVPSSPPTPRDDCSYARRTPAATGGRTRRQARRQADVRWSSRRRCYCCTRAL